MNIFILDAAFLLTIDNFSFLTYRWSFFAYNFGFFCFTYSWSFFAYSGKVRLIRALRDCKQRSLTVSKKAPTVSKKLPPFILGGFSSSEWRGQCPPIFPELIIWRSRSASALLLHCLDNRFCYFDGIFGRFKGLESASAILFNPWKSKSVSVIWIFLEIKFVCNSFGGDGIDDVRRKRLWREWRRNRRVLNWKLQLWSHGKFLKERFMCVKCFNGIVVARPSSFGGCYCSRVPSDTKLLRK